MTKKKGVQHLVRLAPSLLEKHGLSENFYFTGKISRKKVLGYLQHADIFAHPSSDEGFGISILEAILKKVPVVAMNHSGVSDTIENGVNSFLADNLTEFSPFLEILIENPSLRVEFSQKAAEGLSKYDWNRNYELTCGVYKGVINGKYQSDSTGQDSPSESDRKLLKRSEQRE